MARKQLGAAESASQDAATKGYVDSVAQKLLANGSNLTGAATLAANTFYTVDATSASIALTLPTTPALGTQIMLWRTDSTTNLVNVSPGGSDTLAESTGGVWQLYRGAGGVMFIYIGTVWYAIPIIGGISGLTPRASSSAVGGAIAQRDGNANLQVGTATAGGHAANKTYVDALVAPHSFAAVVGSGTLSADTTYLVDATSGAMTLTLPTSPTNRTIIELTRIDSAFSNAVTIQPGGTNTLAGASPFTLKPGMGLALIYRNSTTTWHQIGQVINNLSGMLGPTASNALPPSIVARDSSGRSQFTDPAAAQDAATKNYVDGVVRSITANYTAVNRDIVLANAASGAITVTIPITAGTQVTVKKIDSSTNAVTVVPASGTIDGDASAVITGQDTSAVFIGDGTNAYVESVYEVSPAVASVAPTVITDWNSANAPGDYYGASASNGPATATYVGTVYQGASGDTSLVQVVYRLSTSDVPEQWMRQWSSSGGWRSWKRIYDDTGTITSGALSAASGAGVSSYTLRRIGKLVQIYAVLTTPAITVGTSGNITNTSLATITDTRFVPSMNTALASGATGDIAAFIITSSGIIQITAFPPGHANVTAGSSVSCGGSYIAAN